MAQWFTLEGKPFVPEGRVTPFDPETGLYTAKDRIGRVRKFRRAAEVLQPPKPKPSMRDDIRAMRKALTGEKSSPAEESEVETDDGDVKTPDSFYLARAKYAHRLAKAVERRKHGNRVRVALGSDPLKISPEEDIRRDGRKVAWLIVFCFAAAAWIATVKHWPEPAAPVLTTNTRGR